MKKILKKINNNFYRKITLWSLKKKLPKNFLNHLATLKNSDYIIDVGANVGLVTEIMAQTNAKVIAFEPNNQAFKKLNKLRMRYKNLETINKAASIKDGKLKLFFHKNTKTSNNDLTQASSLLKNKPNVSEDLFETVDTIDFAKYIFSLNTQIELMKIDIEGYEIELINHLISTGAINKINIIYCETHEKKFNELKIKTQQMKENIKKNNLSNKFDFNWI